MHRDRKTDKPRQIQKSNHYVNWQRENIGEDTMNKDEMLQQKTDKEKRNRRCTEKLDKYNEYEEDEWKDRNGE